MSSPIVWRMPQGVSASKNESTILRAKHYRFELEHFLKDGTRIVPNLGTVFSVLQAYDTFGKDAPLVIAITCAGRKWLLGNNNTMEAKTISSYFSDKTSIVGFPSFGEIGCKQIKQNKY